MRYPRIDMKAPADDIIQENFVFPRIAKCFRCAVEIRVPGEGIIHHQARAGCISQEQFFPDPAFVSDPQICSLKVQVDFIFDSRIGKGKALSLYPRR